MFSISTTVDGVFHSDDVEPRMLPVHYLRTRLGRTGTVIGCDTSNCGACTVLLNGLTVKSCTVLAIQADGSEITTVQGLADGELHPVQKAFHDNHGLQCGYCTAGMIVSAVDLLMENPDRRRRKCGRGWRAISAGAPATTTLSRQCELPPPNCPARRLYQPKPSSRSTWHPDVTVLRTPSCAISHPRDPA